MKERFLQLHILTAYPPSNVNRDDMGRPKTAVVGGATRLRISSQALKRAWRTSDVFETALAGYVGTRTKALGEEICQDMINAGVTEKNAVTWATAMVAPFGKVETDKDAKKEAEDDEDAIVPAEDGSDKKKKTKENKKVHLSQLVHFSPEEETAIRELAKAVAARQFAPTDDEIKGLLKKEISAVDIALFGRMLADSPANNMDAAAQVAHAITTHKISVEEDFFTAVDDLNDGQEDRGSAHLGVMEFGSGLFYTYICINRALLTKNLQGDEALAQKTLKAFVEAAATVAPSGKQNSFASHVRASYVLAELGNQQPRSLSLAFQKPVDVQDIVANSIQVFEKTRDAVDVMYGACADRQEVRKLGGEGNLQTLLDFVVS
jgi:CRISPR system Cascade subunit CasC